MFWVLYSSGGPMGKQQKFLTPNENMYCFNLKGNSTHSTKVWVQVLGSTALHVKKVVYSLLRFQREQREISVSAEGIKFEKKKKIFAPFIRFRRITQPLQLSDRGISGQGVALWIAGF